MLTEAWIGWVVATGRLFVILLALITGGLTSFWAEEEGKCKDEGRVDRRRPTLETLPPEALWVSLLALSLFSLLRKLTVSEDPARESPRGGLPWSTLFSTFFSLSEGCLGVLKEATSLEEVESSASSSEEELTSSFGFDINLCLKELSCVDDLLLNSATLSSNFLKNVWINNLEGTVWHGYQRWYFVNSNFSLKFL